MAVLRIGLTGGIGAGKSTVSSTFSELGGVVVDGDVIAREVVAPGTEGLAKLVEAFGDGILLPDGALDRPALAAVAFSDDERRKTLNGVVHPLVAKRREELIAAAPADAVIVEDIPLLVESQMAPMFPLVIIVHAEEDVRVARLIEHRGFSETDARARIKAQATVDQRLAVADVWLENHGSADELRTQAQQLWHDRIVPFAHNVDAGVVAPVPTDVVPYVRDWPAQAERIVNRLNTACGHRAVRIDHVGATAVPDVPAADVIDVQVTVASLEVADELRDALSTVGYPRVESVDGTERLHGSADPGRPTRVHLRAAGTEEQRLALLLRDWLRADADARAEFVDGEPDVARQRARRWAAATDWTP